jgi:peptidoglycan/xylan/chitin deacetylase (PgdA/CDA1 family)
VIGARYVVRFDDLCPTMNWIVWEKIEAALIGLKIRPILGVVADNQDEVLVVSPPREDFWSRVRSWQARGWSIGIHGYQHRTITSDAGLVGINARSEFAGLSRADQEAKLRSALALFQREGVDPMVWLAPNHSFDDDTVAALLSLGIQAISDGLWLWPFVDEDGMKWIPQQLWRFHRMPFGVWTVACHHNRWTDEHLAAFESDLHTYRKRIVDVPSLLRITRRKKGVIDGMVSRSLLIMLKTKRRIREQGLMSVGRDAY